MRRQWWSWVKAGLLLVGFVLAAAGVLLALVKREPDFYRAAVAVGPQPDDPAVARTTETRLGELVSAVSTPYATPGDWATTFTADELNAFLREGDDNSLLLSMFLRPLREEYSDPRVSIDGDRLLFGARKGDGGFWTTVVNVEVRAWLIADEPNAVAVELVAVRAGVLPLDKRQVMDELSKYAADNHAAVTWYRSGSNPVGVCRLRVDQTPPDVLLQTVSVGDGRVTIGGKGMIGQ